MDLSNSSMLTLPFLVPLRQQFSLRSSLPFKRESLWKIEAGVVRTLTYLEDGTIATLELWGSGDVVGKALSRINPFQIECLTNVEVTLLPVEKYEQLAEVLLIHVQQMEVLMMIRSYKRVDIMLIKLLSWLTTRFGHAIAAGNLIDLRLTHQDIADLLGTTRVTVTRTLSKFEEQGIIERLRGHRIVLKAEGVWHYEI
jgi:CRP-like cAMP-binding protein